MGCFSWMFCDKQNKKPLCIGDVGYLLYPDGSYVKTEAYDGYGRFGRRDEVDVFEAVADWNRKYLSEHPDFLIPQHGKFWDDTDQCYKDAEPKKVSEFPWYPLYSDLTKAATEVTAAVRELLDAKYWEYRYIGIDLACYDDENAALPFPIKIASEPADYNLMPPSDGDPNQGFGDEDNEDEDEPPLPSPTVYVLLRCRDQGEYTEPRYYASAEPAKTVEGVFWLEAIAKQEKAKLEAELAKTDEEADDDEEDEDNESYYFEIVEQPLR